ncbi:MAG TPA: transcriptional regulator [Candidatus Thermoplasmatota archaeon]|nr:transcriptional regulator [Candidatus Thermoplasmatota archaeon]
MSRMVIHQQMRFAALQKSTELTAGNLASHVETLAKAGYVQLDLDESKVERRKTVRITPTGDAAFRAYVHQVRAVMEDVQADLDASGHGRGLVSQPERPPL